MRYKVFLTIAFAVIILCASFTAVVGGRFSYNDNKDRIASTFPETKGIFGGTILSFLQKILAKLFEIFKPKNPIDPPADSDLSFTLDLKESYNLSYPVEILANLTNIGDKDISILEMNFKSGTLDYFIDTPDGHTIHWIERVDESVQHVRIIKPQESDIAPMDIKIPGLFGYEENGEKIPYEFISGNYTIYGHCRSILIPGTSSSNSSVGEMNTSKYDFTILP